MNNDRLQELIGRTLAGEAGPEEAKELDALLAADNDAMARYQLLHQFWDRHDTPSQQHVEDALHNLLGQLQLSPTSAVVPDDNRFQIKRYWWRRVSAAAVIIALVGIGYLYWANYKKTPAVASLVEKHNARGTKSTITLTDGSKVWLNADSKLQYPEVFSGNLREVYLNGEAFFEVTKNPSRPFIIHLANGTVRVLGTSFNIRAYDNEKTVETSVTTGKVAFIPKYESHTKKQDTIFITPNNKVRYSPSANFLKLESTIAAEDKAWTEGKLIFNGITLDEIAIELERYFGKQVTFLDSSVKTYRLTGSFQNNSLEEIMYYLSQTKDFNYKITNSELLISVEKEKLQ
jgi:ferric-dicitrate binding protein FerR (iron transport regulator)